MHLQHVYDLPDVVAVTLEELANCSVVDIEILILSNHLDPPDDLVI